MSYSASEVKSGFFILFTIAALLVMTFVVGGLRGGEKSEYQVRFGYVGGLERGAPVYFAGREVGKVTRLEIENGEERPIVITVEIPKGVIVRVDSPVYIDTLGMMGEKLVEVGPGTKSQPVLQPGAELAGEDPIPMHEMIGKLNTLSNEMVEMSDSLNPLIVSLNDLMQKNSQTIQELLGHMNGTTKGLSRILNGNQEQISKIIANLEATSSNVRDLTADLKNRPWRLVRKNS
jgi:phospholipid/cholesterol/gamma-HCH transport system substrate-binding protein